MVSCCEGLGRLLSDSRPHIYLHNVHMNPNDGDGDTTNLIPGADESHSDSDELDLILDLSSVREPPSYIKYTYASNRWRRRCNRSEYQLILMSPSLLVACVWLLELRID